MGKGGRGDERRYMGVCSDGFGRREVDDEQVEWCADESCIIAIGGVKRKGRTLHNDSAPDAQLGGVMYQGGRKRDEEAFVCEKQAPRPAACGCGGWYKMGGFIHSEA